MTEQEQFEADYLAAFNMDAGIVPFAKQADGSYWLEQHNDAYAVWQQQAARHKAEISSPQCEVVQAIVDEMRETAAEFRIDDRGAGIVADEDTAELLEEWASRIEARTDGIYEDVYGQLAEMLEPYIKREGKPGHFPPSIVDSVKILLESFLNHKAEIAELAAVIEDHKRLVRELDVIWNGVNGAADSR